MDFTFTEEQDAVAGIAAQIFGDLATTERVKEVEQSADRVDRALWNALGAAGLLGIAIPEARAERQPDGTWRLSGERISVPYAHVAGRVLTSAAVAGTDDLIVVLLDPQAGGVGHERAEATDHQILTHLTLDGARVTTPDVVAGPERGMEATRWIHQRALVGISAIQLGVAEEALALAAAYTSSRIQFGKPLSSFQSTSARAADAYIDIEAMRSTLWQASWRLDTGRDASVAVEVAKWWAAEAGQRVVHTTQHLHGGMGADLAYPIHRYFLMGKQLEDTLGGGSAHLARIGASLAAV